MKPFAFALLLIATLRVQPSGTVADPDAYAIYNALIPSNWLLRVAHASELLIQDTTEFETLMGQECFPSGPDLIGPWAEALAALKEQNATAQTLARQFALPVSYRLESKEQIKGFFKPTGGGWTDFSARYPNARGFLSVSAVGFDKAHQVAIVYMAHSCGLLCGGGGYEFFWHEPGQWTNVRLRANTCGWAS